MDTLGGQEDERGCQAACQVLVESQVGLGSLFYLVLLAAGLGSGPIVIPMRPSLWA